MMRIVVGKNGRVDCRTTLHVPLPPAVVWGQLRDFHRFASHDHFHDAIKIENDIPQAGAALVMRHRFLFISIPRVGRILRWQEWSATTRRAGFAFSDLSLNGPCRGFPHVFGYDLRADDMNGSCLNITVRGRWTAGIVPGWAARLWLWWVFGYVVTRVRNDLLVAALGHRDGARKKKTPRTVSANI